MPELQYTIKDAKLAPRRATLGSAGWDICAAESITVYPGERVLVSTGLHVAVREGMVLKLYPRSGTAKNGITLANCVGIIDSDYRGEVKLLVTNITNDVKHIDYGDRIAQGLLERVSSSRWVEVDELDETARGSGGFGSTGK